MDLKLHKLLGNLNGEAFVCTGVPAHVALLRDIHSLKRDFQASAKEILICQEKLLRENLSKLKNGSQLSTRCGEKYSDVSYGCCKLFYLLYLPSTFVPSRSSFNI